MLRRVGALGVAAATIAAFAGCGRGDPASAPRPTRRPSPGATAPVSPEPPPSPFGVNLSWDDTKPSYIHPLIDATLDLHIKWVRVGFDAFDGGSRDGRLDFRFADDVVDRFRKKGVGVLLVLGGSRGACTVPGVEGTEINCPPDRSREQQYAAYMEEVVRHFTGRVTYYESWNEPNDKAYWVTGPDPLDYARVLSVQYPAIKRANPDARVLFASTGATDLPWTVRALAALGGERLYDAVSLHPYRVSGGPYDPTPFTLADGSEAMLDMKAELLASIEVFRRYDADHGRSAEASSVWLTEVGWGAKSARGGEEIGGVTLLSFADQARYLEEVIQLVRDPELEFVQFVLWWNAVDLAETDPEAPYFDFYGLLRRDLARKPAADAFAGLASTASS